MKTRTSITHPLQIDTLQIDGVSGLIGLTMCPGKSGPSSLGDYAWSRDLQADTKVIAEWGADLWICLMEPEEMKTHGVAALPAAAGRVARYMNLPISDLCAPDERFESTWTTVGPLVHKSLQDGKKVLIHCRGGVGRAGTIAARLLVEFGQHPARAIPAVRAARKGAIETSSQESYLASLVPLRGIARRTDKREGEINPGSNKNDRAALACGGLLGLLTGDALGVPHEFKSAADIPPSEQIEMVMPSHYKRSYRQVPYGTWSDDGAQALCLLESLFAKGDLDPADLGARLVSWWQEGHMAVDGKVFDIGTQTSQALSRLRAGVAPLEAGAGASTGAGNGSLMRVLSLALWHKGSTEALFEKAMRQSMVTHAALEAQLCCALYCGVSNGLLDGLEMNAAWDAAEAALRRYCASNVEQLRVLEQRILTSPYRTNPTGTGYVVDALWSARACLRENDYAAVVRAAVRIGCDTDTTAAIAGGLAGIAFTGAGIPAHWMQSLRGRDIAEPLLDALRKHHGDGAPQAPNISGYANSNLLRETIARHGIGSRQSFRNLSVYPLISTNGSGTANYRLLDEAITEGMASITEVSEAGHVPELAFKNRGDRPVLLIDGQELRGARQNRALNITILAEPESELIIPVACVERGRWAYRQQDLQTSEEILFSSARAERARSVSESMRRKAGARADQQRLWQMIDERLRSSKSSSDTDAMADLYESNRDRLAAYCQAFTWLPNQAGVVFAIDGKPVAVELFDSPTTFGNHFDKILRSFALDAAGSTQPVETGPELRTVQAYLEEVCSADTQSFKSIGAGVDLRLASDRISGGALVAEDRVVHLSGFCL